MDTENVDCILRVSKFGALQVRSLRPKSESRLLIDCFTASTRSNAKGMSGNLAGTQFLQHDSTLVNMALSVQTFLATGKLQWLRNHPAALISLVQTLSCSRN
jgi:hypothetical protein